MAKIYQDAESIKKKMKKTIVVAALVFLGVVFLGSSIYTVKSTERGILSTFGKINPDSVEPGLNFKIPFIQSVDKMSIQTQKMSLTENVYTKDVQTASVMLEVNYDLQPGMVAQLYQQVGKNYEERILIQIIRGAVKDAFGDCNATEIVENRDIVRRRIEEDLRNQMSDQYFSNIKVQISNIDYDDSFEQSIINKQVAEQNALTAKNNTVKIEEEAKQTKIRAEAEAEAIRIKAQALEKNPKITEYEAIQKWNGELPTYMLGNSTPFINIK